MAARLTILTEASAPLRSSEASAPLRSSLTSGPPQLMPLSADQWQKADDEWEESEWVDNPRCFCCRQSVGILLAVFLPVGFGLLQTIWLTLLIFYENIFFAPGTGLLFHGIYEKAFMEFFVSFIGLLVVAFNMPPGLRKRLASIWLLSTVAMVSMYITHGFEKAGFIGAFFLREDIEKYADADGRRDFFGKLIKLIAGDVNGRPNRFYTEAAENANVFGGFLLTDALKKGWAIGVQFAEIVAAIYFFSPSAYITFIFLGGPHFTGYFFGGIPALTMTVCVPFVYEFVSSYCGITLVRPRRGGLRNFA